MAGSYQVSDYSGIESKGDKHDSIYGGEAFYSVGAERTLKEKIADVHGYDSRQVSFIDDLENFFNDKEKYQHAAQKFKTYVKCHINPPQNAESVIDELMNSGYIMALERLSAPNSSNDLKFYKRYAANRGVTRPQAMLFGPNGTVRQAFSIWKIQEALRGQHRAKEKPHNHQTMKVYNEAAFNTYSIPEIKNKHGDYEQVDISADNNKLPDGLEGQIAKSFNRNPNLRGYYVGTKRLSGDLSYKIVEAMAIEFLAKQNDYKPIRLRTSQLEDVIVKANEAGKDAFVELYNISGKDDKFFEYYWDKARKTLNDYAITLWQKRDCFRQAIAKRKAKPFPGTIYINNGRYYWLPKKDEKPLALIPESRKNKLPGSLLKNEPGGYFWWMPYLKFRRRLIPEGQKTATKDYKIAKKLQQKEWEKIQKYEPKIAEKLMNVRICGRATKHKPTACKIAKKLWHQIQENDPEKAARIMYDGRPEKTKPDIDKVWPCWAEEKERLLSMKNEPQMPIVYPEQAIHDECKYGLRVPKKLEKIVEKIKNVDWLKRDAMLVFEDKALPVPREIAIKSNGKEWTNEQEKYGKRFVMQGCTCIDRDTGRIRIDIYSPGFGKPRILTEKVYQVVYEIIRETSPKTLRAIQKWYDKGTKTGADSTIPISEAFAKTMAIKETGLPTDIPSNVVKYAQKIFSDKCKVEPSVIEKIKSKLTG
ncbi:MAG: hypothetical protein A2Y10_06060 [Planctomycetes bacterium GWF2_41_51]|nr:MAG: hypothetical protein A2Y10_06060 [Planctomycetes bacterium GWF2_41_51]